VSKALNAGGFPQNSSWTPGVRSWSWVQDFVNYFRNNYSTTWTNITSNLTTNAVPQAQPGDVIVYDWEGDGVLDHMAFVVKIASGQYPEVSEMGQFDFNAHPEYYITHPRSSYQTRGWTWSAMHGTWLQSRHPNMRAYLLHINGGVFIEPY
jgi:hypothetical protein